MKCFVRKRTTARMHVDLLKPGYRKPLSSVKYRCLKRFFFFFFGEIFKPRRLSQKSGSTVLFRHGGVVSLNYGTATDMCMYYDPRCRADFLFRHTGRATTNRSDKSVGWIRRAQSIRRVTTVYESVPVRARALRGRTQISISEPRPRRRQRVSDNAD